MRPVSRRHSRRGLVGGSTFRRTPISRSPLDKNPMPGHLSELHPVNAVNTKGQFSRASFGKNPRFQIQLDKRPLSPGYSREATCRAVFGTWGSFPDDARASHCPFVLTSFTGWSSKRCPGIGFLSRGDREIGVLRNVEPPTRPRLECRRETGLILRCDRKVGNPFQTKQGSRPSCPDQEGRKGSEEGVPENLGVPLEGDRDF